MMRFLPVLLTATRDFADAWFQAREGSTTTLNFVLTSAMLPDVSGLAVAKIVVFPLGLTLTTNHRCRVVFDATPHNSGERALVNTVPYFLIDGAPTAGDTLEIRFYSDSFTTAVAWSAISDVVVALVLQ